jgi:hypothetical protein
MNDHIITVAILSVMQLYFSSLNKRHIDLDFFETMTSFGTIVNIDDALAKHYFRNVSNLCY